MPNEYVAKIGMNYKPKGSKEEIRAEADDIVSGLSEKELGELVESGVLERREVEAEK